MPVTSLSEITGLETALSAKASVSQVATLVQDHLASNPPAASWSGLTGTPSTFTPSAHTHVIADVTGLQTALDGKQAAGSYLTGNQAVTLSGDASGTGATAITVTLATVNANTGTFGGAATVPQISVNGKGLITGVTAVSITAPWAGLTGVPAAVSSLSGTNTGDQTSVTGNAGTATKLATARTINGVSFDGSANITINAVDSTARVPATLTVSTTAPLTGGGALSGNLTLGISAATISAAGSMSAADKTKLDGIATGATANATDAQLRDRSTHTGADSLDATTDSATRLAMTAAERTKLSAIATAATANATDAAANAHYRTLLDSSGSHTAARVAGTYGMAQGDPLAISGTGTLYPLNIIYLDPADYPAIGALTAKLRLRCIVEANDVAPTGNYTVGLHPVTRPATSGGTGLCIYTIGTAVTNSTATSTAPAADSQSIITSTDFAVPAAGYYVIGVVTTAAVATSAHMHFSAALMMRYS